VTVHRGTAAYWQLSSTSRVGRVAAPLLAIVVAAVALLAAIVLAVAMLLVGVLVAVALFVRKAVTSGSGGDRDRA
jgi:hypothetical protein